MYKANLSDYRHNNKLYTTKGAYILQKYFGKLKCTFLLHISNWKELWDMVHLPIKLCELIRFSKVAM